MQSNFSLTRHNTRVYFCVSSSFGQNVLYPLMQKGFSGLIPSKLHSLKHSTSISFSFRKCCNNRSFEVSAPLIFREATHMEPVLPGFFLFPAELAEDVEFN